MALPRRAGRPRARAPRRGRRRGRDLPPVLACGRTSTRSRSVCEEEGKIVRIPMDVLDRTIATGRIEELDGTPVFSLVSGPGPGAWRSRRSGFADIVGASLGLVLLSPLFLGDRDRDRARRRRAGVLPPDADRPPRAPVRDAQVPLDARRTPRSEPAELDHLNERRQRPGLQAGRRSPGHEGRAVPAAHARSTSCRSCWNVLRGQMSLVGPRPPLPSEVEGYDLWHRRRLSMKPGITGLWQVRGRRDPEFDRWVEADLEYIDRWSLWLDLKILLPHDSGRGSGPLATCQFYWGLASARDGEIAGLVPRLQAHPRRAP